jgi:GTPase SAR1 family protein
MSTSNTIRSQLEIDLINILQLDILDEETADRIILDLINNGRQSLVDHRDDILDDIYLNVMTDNSQLLIILKTSVCNHWSSNIFSSYSWFPSFIEEYQTKSPDLYDEILTRTAEYGRKKFVNSNDPGEQILFIVIQFLFNLTNERIMDGYTFNRIWYTLISVGLKGLQQFEDSIKCKDDEILFQALREYFRPELFSILLKCKIIDCRGLYDFILDNIAEYGWRLGIEHIRNRITPRMFKELTNHVEVLAPTPPIVEMTNEIKNKFLIINDKLFDMKMWSQIGEFNCLSTMIKSILDRYCQHKSITLFLQDCFLPMIYLLKRQENFDYFIQLLQRSCHRSSVDYPNIPLRTLIHVLLSNSDESVRREIINQLNKQNIVPFLQPGNSIPNSDIFYIWDYTRPCLLSFGIGPCQGKSSLLNQLFNTKFEEHNKENLYFQQTIDIDFGLNFLPERQFNLADTHGIISKECLTKFQRIFDGYLIHIDENFLKQYPTVLNEYLSILESNKIRLIIVHNSKSKNKISFTKQSIVLPNLNHFHQQAKIFFMEDIREEINKRFKGILVNREKHQKDVQELSIDYNLINKLTTKCLTNISIEKNEIQFPYYVKFVKICQQRQEQRNQAFIEVKENTGETLELFDQIYSSSGNKKQV